MHSTPHSPPPEMSFKLHPKYQQPSSGFVSPIHFQPPLVTPGCDDVASCLHPRCQFGGHFHGPHASRVQCEQPEEATQCDESGCGSDQRFLAGQLSRYEVSLLDDILWVAAQEVRLSKTEHAALKMDLFRNYIRSYGSLRDAIGRNQLQRIIHPVLSEVIAKNMEDKEKILSAEGNQSVA